MLAPQRKFLKGLLFGLLAGFAVGAALNDKQRKQLATEIKKTAAPLGRSIGDNVGQVADTVVDQTAAKIDDAGDAVAAQIAGGGATDSTAG